jgi:hypothetical protein
MQEHIQINIKQLEEENERLRKQIEENEVRIRSLQAMLPNEPMPPLPLRLLEGTDTWGSGSPPVPGAVSARTQRDVDGNIRILLCRSNAGLGWVYTPVADGWVVVSHESDYV